MLPGQNLVLSPFNQPNGDGPAACCGVLAVPFSLFPTMTQDQIKDLKGRAEALRRYL